MKSSEPIKDYVILYQDFVRKLLIRAAEDVSVKSFIVEPIQERWSQGNRPLMTPESLNGQPRVHVSFEVSLTEEEWDYIQHGYKDD